MDKSWKQPQADATSTSVPAGAVPEPQR